MHKVNDLVIHCIDFRFRKQIAEWIDTNLNGQADLVAMAGVSKAILDEDTREATLKQIGLSQQLHAMTTVNLLDHIDCGAYGGSASQENKEAEIALHKEKLNQAVEIIKQKFPDLNVKKYIVDFSTIQEID